MISSHALWEHTLIRKVPRLKMNALIAQQVNSVTRKPWWQLPPPISVPLVTGVLKVLKHHSLTPQEMDTMAHVLLVLIVKRIHLSQFHAQKALTLTRNVQPV